MRAFAHDASACCMREHTMREQAMRARIRIASHASAFRVRHAVICATFVSVMRVYARIRMASRATVPLLRYAPLT